MGNNVYMLTMMGLYAVTLGRKLMWDKTTRHFINDNAGNSMMTRAFRETWVDQHVTEWVNKFQSFDLK